MVYLAKSHPNPIGYLLYVCVAIVIAMILTPWARVAADTDTSLFTTLQDTLIKDGFSKNEIHSLYQHKGATFDAKSVSLFFMHRESTLNYNQFSAQNNLDKAREYMATHEAILNKVAQDTGVSPQVITAIILVETKFGTYLGNRNIFNTLSTMAALKDPSVLETFWEMVPAERRLERKAFEKKAKQKSGWAYGELKAFIQYTKREKISPHNIKGSYAGALGIAQFMPSSILSYARDGNQDNRIDLFDHADAIASIGNYLKAFGWHPGIDRKKAYKIVLRYNNSSYYANTVLKVADKLKG